MILASGATLGLISVVFGAFAEHSLRENISAEHFRFLMTAVRYNQVHAVVVTAIGLSMLNGSTSLAAYVIKLSSLLFLIGTILFSFSIYLSVWLGIPLLLSVTPVGGVTIMLAWVTLVFAGIYGLGKQNGSR
ncbi:MAG: hypothetical protein TECD_00162 [Hyphomicrobiaceae bacterium hypho_1]